MEAQLPQQPTAHGKRSGAARRKLKKDRQAQLDAQCAQHQLPPPRLPPELQLKIIQAGAEEGPHPMMYTGPETLERRTFLRQASLVCSLWRLEAQSLLWTTPHLKTNDSIKSFLATANKSGSTYRLALGEMPAETWTPLDGSLAALILHQCQTVQAIHIAYAEHIDPWIFCDPSLADLSRLSLLGEIRIKATARGIPKRLAFTLKHLHLDLLYPLGEGMMPNRFVASLLEATSGSVVLVIDDSRNQYPTLGVQLPELSFTGALRFTHLNVDFGTSSLDLLRPLLPLFVSCKSLETLSINQLHPAMFAALASPIDHLVLTSESPDRDFAEEIRLPTTSRSSLVDQGPRHHDCE